MTPAITDILNQIQRNQQQIDLLTTNNTQLVNYLIQAGMLESLKQIPGFSFNSSQGVAAPPLLTAGATIPAEEVVSDKAKGWTPARRRKLSKIMKAKFETDGGWGANAQKKKRSWTPEQRERFSRKMKARYKKYGGLARPANA